MPALFTRTSILPYCSNMRPPNAATASRSQMSRVSAEAEPPEALICATMSSAAAPFLSTTRTCAPSAAIAAPVGKPKPRPPPVTTAVLPESRIISFVPSCLNHSDLRIAAYESQDPGSRQDESLVIVLAHVVTVLSELRIAADEQQHLALVATCDVLVDPGEPGDGLAQQQLTHQLGAIKRISFGRGGFGFDAMDAGTFGMGHHVAQPVNGKCGTAWNVAEGGATLWPDQHEEIGEPGALHAHIGLDAFSPFVFQHYAARAANVDAVPRSLDRVKAGRINDDVEVVQGMSGPHAIGGDSGNRRRVQIDNRDILLVVDLVIFGLERNPLQPETMVLGYQQFSDTGILDPFTNFPRHEIRDVFIRCRV